MFSRERFLNVMALNNENAAAQQIHLLLRQTGDLRRHWSLAPVKHLASLLVGQALIDQLSVGFFPACLAVGILYSLMPPFGP